MKDIAFLIDIDERYLELKNADDEQSKFANNVKGIDDGMKSIEKKLFLSNIGLFFIPKEKIFNNFKNRLFLIKSFEPKLEEELEPELEQELEQELKPEPKPIYRKYSLKSLKDF